MRTLAAVAFLSALVGVAGCATTTGSDPTTTYSGFDKARVVTIAEHGNACKDALCSGLGAQWTSVAPDEVIVSVTLFNKFVGITGASLNLDGDVVKLTPTNNPTIFGYPDYRIRESRKTFVLPLNMVRRIAASKSAWLRVFTVEGHTEDAVIDGDRDSKAFHALRRFLAEVDQKPA